MSRGRHSRPRRIASSRLFLALAVGGTGLAAPLVFAGGAQAAPASAASASASESAASASEPAADTYTVARGDTLHRIATAHDIEGGWSAVYDANREVVGADPHLIVPGQELTLGQGEEASTERADRTAARTAVAGTQNYSDNLDGWIREALSIMEQRGIPGSYEGIERNIMRESGGNPSAVNNWDVNAQNGTPSIGLLQVIKPTFDAYHVEGTAYDQYDPVANIVAACNYAADRYGSIDNVNGAY